MKIKTNEQEEGGDVDPKISTEKKEVEEQKKKLVTEKEKLADQFGKKE